MYNCDKYDLYLSQAGHLTQGDFPIKIRIFSPPVVAVGLKSFILGSRVECSTTVLPLNTQPGNAKGGSITVPVTSCLNGLESAV